MDVLRLIRSVFDSGLAELAVPPTVLFLFTVHSTCSIRASLHFLWRASASASDPAPAPICCFSCQRSIRTSLPPSVPPTHQHHELSQELDLQDLPRCRLLKNAHSLYRTPSTRIQRNNNRLGRFNNQTPSVSDPDPNLCPTCLPANSICRRPRAIAQGSLDN